jgi:hypothetical protein
VTQSRNKDPKSAIGGVVDPTVPDLNPPSGVTDSPLLDATQLDATLSDATDTEQTLADFGHGTAHTEVQAVTFERSLGDEGSDSVVVRRSRRIDRKVALARELLATLARDDRRSRLLHAAIVRRDETLLDALLEANSAS